MAFDASTHKKTSQFEMMEMETNEKVDPGIQRVIQRADPAPDRGRGRERNKRRGRRQPSGAERAHTRAMTRMKNEMIQAEEMTTNEAHEVDQIV